MLRLWHLCCSLQLTNLLYMITIRGGFQHSHFSIDDAKAPRDRQSSLSRTLPPEGSALGLQACNKVQMVLLLCHLPLQVLSASAIPLQRTHSKAVNFLNSFPTSCPPFPLKLYQTIFWTCPSTDTSWPRSPIVSVWPNPINRIWHGWWRYSGTESLAFWPPHSLGPHLTHWLYPLSFPHWSLLPIPIFKCWESPQGFVLGPLLFPI